MNALRLFALPAFLALAACGGGDTPDDDATVGGTEATDAEELALPTLIELIQNEGRLSVLAEALTTAGLDEQLMGDGPITIFAPSDEAFANLPGVGSSDVLFQPANLPLLQQILAYHVVEGSHPSATLRGSSAEFVTSGGASLSYDGSGPVITVGSPPATAVVFATDLQASNGVIHMIDTVLLPTE